DPAVRAANADVDVPRGLDAERRIADLVRARCSMRTVRVQLLRRGHALGPRGVHGDRDVHRKLWDRGGRDARRGLRIDRAAERLVPHALGAPAERRTPRPESSVLEHENARAAAVDRRNECLVADGLELACAELRAERAAPLAPRRMLDLDAGLVRIAAKTRRDRAAVDLEMLVLADADPKLDAREPR